MAKLANLLADQSRLIATIQALMATLGAPDGGPQAAAAPFAALIPALSDFRKAEEAAINRGLLTGNEKLLPLHRLKSDAYVALKADWAAYAGAWAGASTAEGLAADWPAFAQASRTILPRMLAQLEIEHETLASIASR
jgi:hypothetical protein